MDDKTYKEFLESQLQWSKNQTAILDEMESKLGEMKEIAEQATKNDLSGSVREQLNCQLERLKYEYGLMGTRYSLLLSKNLV